MPEDKPGPENSDNSAHASPEGRSRPRKHRRIWRLILVVGLLAVAWLLYRHQAAKHAKPAPHPPAVQVETATATNGSIGIYVNALGLVTPVRTVTVTSLATGKLIRVDYVEGQLVNAGDLLVEIDPRANQAQLTTFEGQYERDLALLAETRMDLERFQEAYASNAIPKQQLDDQAALLRQNEGTVKFDQGQVETAKVQLDYCWIHSPISGRVGLRLVDPGNIVIATASNALVVVTQLQPITIIYSVAEDYLPQIQGQLAQGHRMTVEAYDRAQQKRIATGELSALDNQIDPTTGTLRLRAVFSNEDYALFPNQFVNVKHLIDTLQGAILVPSAVIQRGAQGSFVYVVKPDHTVASRPVTVGATDGNVTAVQGVEPGEIIAASNFNRLQNGVRITVMPPPGSTNQKGKP
ncbi:MAG: Efflux transporter, family, subunit [Pedosphaera sp.]|nr:Efflux transporter, family, subunit [Pedosphaera sp.]